MGVAQPKAELGGGSLGGGGRGGGESGWRCLRKEFAELVDLEGL